MLYGINSTSSTEMASQTHVVLDGQAHLKGEANQGHSTVVDSRRLRGATTDRRPRPGLPRPRRRRPPAPGRERRGGGEAVLPATIDARRVAGAAAGEAVGTTRGSRGRSDRRDRSWTRNEPVLDRAPSPTSAAPDVKVLGHRGAGQDLESELADRRPDQRPSTPSGRASRPRTVKIRALILAHRSPAADFDGVCSADDVPGHRGADALRRACDPDFLFYLLLLARLHQTYARRGLHTGPGCPKRLTTGSSSSRLRLRAPGRSASQRREWHARLDSAAEETSRRPRPTSQGAQAAQEARLIQSVLARAFAGEL